MYLFLSFSRARSRAYPPALRLRTRSKANAAIHTCTLWGEGGGEDGTTSIVRGMGVSDIVDDLSSALAIFI
jgi:hypothetical protein